MHAPCMPHACHHARGRISRSRKNEVPSAATDKRTNAPLTRTFIRFDGDACVVVTAITSSALAKPFLAKESPIKSAFREHTPVIQEMYSVEQGPSFAHDGHLFMRFPTATLDVSAIEPAFWTWLVESGQAAALGLRVEVVGECAHGRADRFPFKLKGQVIRKYFEWINHLASVDTAAVRSALKIPSDIQETKRAFKAFDSAGEMHAFVHC